MADILSCASEMAIQPKNKSLIFCLDARAKIICAFAGIFVAAFLSSAITALPVIVICFLLAAASGISIRAYIRRMIFPIVFGGFVAATQALLGSASFGVLVFARVLAAASLLNLLSLTTPIQALLEALGALRVPPVILDLTSLMLRFVFLFVEESRKIYAAMSSRLGFSDSLAAKDRLENFSTLAGMLLLKSLKRAERSYVAMLARGYSPESRFYCAAAMEKRDYAAIAVAAILFFSLFIGDRFLRGWT